MKMNPRKLRQGGVATAITAVFVVIMALLILVADAMDSRFGLHADMTENKVFALSEDTKEYLAALEKDITIYVLTPEQDLISGDVYYLQANEVLRRYADSPRVTVEYVDLSRDPGFARNYPQYPNLNASTILLESGEDVVTVSLNDLFNTEYEYVQGGLAEYISSSKAEQVMTAAILDLARSKTLTVTFGSGFGEGDTQGLESLLAANRYTVLHQNLLLEEINPATDILVICGPTRDYSDPVLQKLDKFLENGGQYGKILFYLADVYQPETPNLDAFLAEWGVWVEEGVIRETDSSKLAANSPYWSVAEYGESVFAARAIAQGMYTVVPEARPMSLLFEAQGATAATALLTFTDTACIQPLGELPEGWSANDAPHGPFVALSLSTRTDYRGEGEEEETLASHVAVAASSLLLEPTLLESPYVGNADYLLGLFSGLAGEETGVAIAPKTIGVRYLPISQGTSNLLSALFSVALPLLIALVGAGVYIYRRHL